MIVRSERSRGRVVLYIDSLKLGGAERVTLRLASWLHAAGWEPLLLTRKPISWDFYSVPTGVSRHVEPLDPVWMRCLGPLALPFRLLRLRAWMKDQQVCLVIGMTTIPAIKMLLARRGLWVSCVVSERNYPPLKPLGLPWRVLRRLTYPWADLHLVQTEVVGRWLRRHLAAEPQLLLPNPVIWPLPDGEPRLDPQEWLEKAGVHADDPVLMAVGTKARQKGFDRLVDWFRELAPRHPRLQLVIVGLAAGSYHGRDQQQDLRQQLSSDPSFRSRLHFPGQVGNLQQWYERAQVFVLSSRYEGFPNVLLEAMASGCCCIAADCPQGPAELIKDGLNGRLIPEQASQQIWVEAIDGLLLTPFQCRRFGRAAKAVRELYEPGQLARSFVDAMETLRR